MTINRLPALLLSVIALGSGLFSGCSKPTRDVVQGYIEGDYVYVASPFAGKLESLPVQRGTQAKAGDPLFTLESVAESAARDLAASRLEEGRAKLADALKGKRPEEIDAIKAALDQIRTALALSESELDRQAKLNASGASTAQDLDRARSTRDQNRQGVSQLEAELRSAQLGSRGDQIAAARANVQALDAALAKADWDLRQKHQDATQAGEVFDTLYRVGEWVAAGRPVVVLLPPQNIKLRTFVPETRLGTIHPGDSVRVTIDGLPEAIIGKVSFVSPQAEYTPPVIYSRESRSKLVFLIEAVFDPAAAAKLHPGQPVDVQFEQ
jgi:HlyD family secretion protein